MSDLFTWKHTHGGGLETEKLAANKVQLAVNSIKARILLRLESGGITPDEFAAETGLLINTVRRRFTDLWKEGRIRHHADKITRPNSDNNPCVVWVLGRDENIELSLVQRLREEIRQLREQLAANLP